MKATPPLSSELTRIFLQLMQVAIGSETELETVPDEAGWETLYGFATKQSVVGMTYRAVMSLPERQKPSRKVRMMLAYTADRIEKSNAAMNGNTEAISGWIAGMGMQSCVLKGQGTALLYPEPALRQCGDIDLWVSGDRKQVLAALGTRWKTGKVFYHHTTIHPFKSKTEVEIHFTPSWMNDPFMNRKLQSYFKTQSDAQFANLRPEAGFCIPTTAFNCVYGAVHIYRHLLQEGIGLRQIMDYLYILRASLPEDLRAAAGMLHRLRMDRFTSALMYVEQYLFKLDDGHLVCPGDERMGRFLLDEILTAGNFGRYDPRYRYRSSDSLLRRAAARMGRLVHYIGIAPREVLWAPAFKFWQMLWRRQF